MWDKAPHWDGAGVEVFALVYLQIGLLCLQIVIIAAPVAISYGDLVLELYHKVPRNQMVCVVFPTPLPTNHMGGHGCHGTWLLPSSLMSYHTLYMSLGPILDEDEVWQGIKCARGSEPHHVHRSVTRDSCGWPRMSWTLTVVFPTRVLRGLFNPR